MNYKTYLNTSMWGFFIFSLFARTILKYLGGDQNQSCERRG